MTLLWGACAAVAVLSGFAARLAGDGFAARLLALAPRCPLHVLIGVPCPACGSLRAVLALARGDVAGALSWNPLAAVGSIAFVAGGLVAGGAALFGARVREPRYHLPRAARAAIAAALLLNWAYLIANRI